MLNAPIAGMLNVWGQLVEAMHGVHPYGGTVAEVYAYLLRPDNPLRLTPLWNEFRENEVGIETRRALNTILAEFEECYNASVEIRTPDGFKPYHEVTEPFVHREEIRVTDR